MRPDRATTQAPSARLPREPLSPRVHEETGRAEPANEEQTDAVREVDRRAKRHAPRREGANPHPCGLRCHLFANPARGVENPTGEREARKERLSDDLVDRAVPREVGGEEDLPVRRVEQRGPVEGALRTELTLPGPKATREVEQVFRGERRPRATPASRISSRDPTPDDVVPARGRHTERPREADIHANAIPIRGAHGDRADRVQRGEESLREEVADREGLEVPRAAMDGERSASPAHGDRRLARDGEARRRCAAPTKRPPATAPADHRAREGSRRDKPLSALSVRAEFE